MEPRYKIDLVYTWVNGNDPKWLAKKNTFLHSSTFNNNKHLYNTEYNAPHRYRERQELKYSLRSVCKYMKWINQIYIVTDNQIPDWLDTTKVVIIDHKTILPLNCLPTYNSLAIESYLHRIPNLSKYFIYCNDDIFFYKPVYISDFIINDKTVLYFQKSNYNSQCKLLQQIAYSFPRDPEIDKWITKCGILRPYSWKGIPTINEVGHISQWKNANALLDKYYIIEERQQVAHSPQINNIDVCNYVHDRFYKYIYPTARSHFRSIVSVGTTNALYPYISLYNGKSIKSRKRDAFYVFYLSDNKTLNQIHIAMITKLNPIFVCVQDATTINTHVQFSNYMKSLFPDKCIYEN